MLCVFVAALEAGSEVFVSGVEVGGARGSIEGKDESDNAPIANGRKKVS